MLLKYFEPTKDFSWDELDTITNKPTALVLKIAGEI